MSLQYCDLLHIQPIADRMAKNLEIISDKKNQPTRIQPMGYTISTDE